MIQKILTSTALRALSMVVALMVLFSTPLKAADGIPENYDLEVWQGLQEDLFEKKEIITDQSFLTMEAPYRAHDAALVPITIKAAAPKAGQYYKALTLIIDQNPVPVAAEIELSPKLGPLHIETRVRVNQYSLVRAIVETNDGAFFMVSKYVKAAGGCSAPAMKDMDAKMAMLGQSKLRQFTPKPLTENKGENSADKKQMTVKANDQTREVQLMVRHPNYSGMQLNQETGYYIPAHYVDQIIIDLDGEPLMKIKGAISLSEDPTLRFRFKANSKAPLLGLTVHDTKKQTFKNQWLLKAVQPTGS